MGLKVKVIIRYFYLQKLGADFTYTLDHQIVFERLRTIPLTKTFFKDNELLAKNEGNNLLSLETSSL